MTPIIHNGETLSLADLAGQSLIRSPIIFNGCSIQGSPDVRMWGLGGKYNMCLFADTVDGVITDLDPLNRELGCIKPDIFATQNCLFNGCIFSDLICMFPLDFEAVAKVTGITNWRHEDAPVDGKTLVEFPGS